MNTEKGNKLIAGFMISNEILITPGCEYRSDSKVKCIDDLLPEEEDYADLEYHSSWDWLMPVTDKIDIQLKNGRSFIEHIDGEWWRNFQHVAYYNSKISKFDAVYKAIIKYIKWYNKT